jgi:hypothetical protein
MAPQHRRQKLDPDLTDLADFRTPDECAQALSHYLPADLGQPYIEQCIREGRIPTVGVKFSPIFKPERAKHESIPDKFWIDISQWGIEDLFDCGTVCSSTPTASEKVRSKGQYDLVAGEVTYSDIRLHWPSVERIAGSDKRPATMIRRSVEEPTQTTMKGRPSRTNWQQGSGKHRPQVGGGKAPSDLWDSQRPAAPFIRRIAVF